MTRPGDARAGPPRRASPRGRERSTAGGRSRRLAEHRSEEARQLRGCHGLAAVNITLPGDLTERLGRDVAREDERGQGMTERLAQPRHDLKAVQASWQVVVDDGHVQLGILAGGKLDCLL